MRWSATGLHPQLGENQTLALRADPPRRASVNERGGSNVLVPGYLYHYALDASAAGAELMPTARAVVDALRPVRQHAGPAAPRRGGQLATHAAEPDHAAQVRLRPGGRRDRQPARRGDHPAARNAAHRRQFAPAIVAEVKKAVTEDLVGRARLADGQRQPERCRRRRARTRSPAARRPR